MTTTNTNDRTHNFIRWFIEIGHNDIATVGGKNASLGQMYNELSSKNIKVPNGYVVTTDGYRYFLEYNNLNEIITELLNKLGDAGDIINLKRVGMDIRTQIANGKFPDEFRDEIIKNYKLLSKNYFDVHGKHQKYTDVAVRSSGTGEDLPDDSFAGQQETYLNVRGEDQLIASIKNCFASLYTDRAISYRRKFNFDNNNVFISVCVQKMIRSDLASAGVAFSVDTESGFKDAIIINSSWGLGSNIVDGVATADEFVTYKPSLRNDFNGIISKKIGLKKSKVIYGTKPDEKTRRVETGLEQRNTFSLSDDEVIKLSNWIMIIENHYSEIYGVHTPIDVEFAVDGLNKQLYIVQARPITTLKKYNNMILTEYTLYNEGLTPIINGVAVGDKIASSKVKIILSLDGRDGSYGIEDFEDGDVLVTDITDPTFEPIMQKASAIITNKGSRTSHAAILSRELGVPCIVGTQNSTKVLKNDQVVTVSCCEGEVGFVYDGQVKYTVKETNLESLPETKLDIKMNLANPNKAFKNSRIPNKGVGLVRLEFVINNYIDIHPNAILNYKEMNDEELTKGIESKIKGYKSAKEFYVKQLAYGIAKIAAAFAPYDVVVRFSDFKTNEYAKLFGAKMFEGKEENPMLGWRGCSRYYHNDFKEAFGLECQAIKLVRETMNLKNVVVMFPFVRSVDEIKAVQLIMKENGLERGENDLKVYMMCELPVNCILMDDFCPYIDGASFGTNDLNMLTNGIDRDNEKIEYLFNERNDGLKKMIIMAMDSLKKHNKESGCCGNAPSNYPEFALFLANLGIDSISVTSDVVIKTIIGVGAEEERNRGKID